MEKLGEASFIYLTTPGVDKSSPFIAKEVGDTRARVGDLVNRALPLTACHLFNTSDRAYTRIIEDTHLSTPRV